ncbi:hypothetical protein GGS24DRAFT_496971 [Hypoxylon argillaceum]|nr:hypothetical protein GGS24DRAFT_496971 [Hypoxylon argillaceum]
MTYPSVEPNTRTGGLLKASAKPVTAILYPNPKHTVSHKCSSKGQPAVVRGSYHHHHGYQNSGADTASVSHKTSKVRMTIVGASIGTGWRWLVGQFVGSMLNNNLLIPNWRDWLMVASQVRSPKNRGCSRNKGQFLTALALLMIFASIIPHAAAVDVVPHLRIGSGFTAVSSAISLIPLRRDKRVGSAVLILMYVLSLTCTALFILLQYLNIVRLGPRYLFGTFLLAAHCIIGLSQTSENALEGVIDFGPVIVPVVAALFSVLFQRRQLVLRVEAADSAATDLMTNDAVAEELPYTIADGGDIGLQQIAIF